MAFASLSLASMRTFEGEALLETIETLGARVAIIVGETRHYDLPDVMRPEPGATVLDEDRWTAQVHALLVRAEDIVRRRQSYVLFDLGANLPTRDANTDLLCSVGDIGVNGISTDGKSPEAVLEQISRLQRYASSGEVGKALAEIEGDADLTDRMRLFLKLELYSTVGAQPQIRNMLRDMKDEIPKLPPDQALAIARIAEAADEDQSADTTLTTIIGLLRSKSDLELALRIAARTGRRILIAKCTDALRALHPDSALLWARAAGEAARKGDYAGAAQYLAVSHVPNHAALKTLFEILESHLASPDWQPAALLAEAQAKVPSLQQDAFNETRIALERCGRREEALALVLAANTPTEDDALAALALVERGLRAGDPFLDEARISEAFGLGLSLLSRIPTSGRVRLKLTDAASPTTSTRSTVALIRRALSLWERMPELRARPPVDRRQEALPAEEVVSRTKAIGEWLLDLSGGMFGPKSRALPPSMLPVPAEALISGIVEAVDYLGSTIADETDRPTIDLLASVAVAVAPYSPERDEDLTVIRTVGVRYNVAGFGQSARDQAEMALMIAGDRPERRRRALFTFADVYERMGMRVEALVGLASALEIGAPMTWDDIWAKAAYYSGCFAISALWI